jgi:hypothetical protein
VLRQTRGAEAVAAKNRDTRRWERQRELYDPSIESRKRMEMPHVAASGVAEASSDRKVE